MPVNDKNKKLKILMIGPALPQLGGMEASVSALLESGLRDKFDLVHHNISKFKSKNKNTRIATGYAAAYKRPISVSAKSYLFSLWFYVLYLFRLCFCRIDIVHIHTSSYTSYWEKLVYIYVARFLRKKVILHIHGGMFYSFYEKSRPLFKRLIKHSMSVCQGVIVLSEQWKLFFQTIIPNDKLHVLPNGVHANDIIELLKFPIPTGLFMGQIIESKGIYDLLDAAELLKDRVRTFQLLLAGAGPLEQTDQEIKKRNLENYVKLLGPQTGYAKNELFGTSHFYVLPSHAEGLPISIIEAYSAGLPVIATDVGGIPDLLKDNVNGLLVPAHNPERLAQAIQELIENPKLCKEISKNNREIALEKYDINVIATSLAEIYMELK